MSSNRKHAVSKLRSNNVRNLQKQSQPKEVDPDDPSSFDSRPDDDPIKVKGQNYCVISFLVDTEAMRQNNGLVDPYKHIMIKASGAFKEPADAQKYALKLFNAYNESHPLKAYHHLLVMPLRKFSLLPDMDLLVEDPEDPTKIKPLVNFTYEQEQLAKIMRSVTKDNDVEISDKKRRIAEGKKMGTQNVPDKSPDPTNLDDLLNEAQTTE